MYQKKDSYYHKAKEENYAARSAFKLQEIDQKFHIFKPGQKCLDLGAAPGSWTQVASQRIGKNGKILGIDKETIDLTLPNACFLSFEIVGTDLTKAFEQSQIMPPFSVVLSDMAPKTTGILITDQTRSLVLCEFAFEIALVYLEKGGHFICKIFQGPDFEAFRKKIAPFFSKIHLLKPDSSRKQSKEIYIVALTYKPQVKSG